MNEAKILDKCYFKKTTKISCGVNIPSQISGQKLIV